MAEKDKPEVRQKDETPRQFARRMVRLKMVGTTGNKGLRDRWDKLDDAIHRHGRYLSQQSVDEALGYLEHRFEVSRNLLEGLGHSPEFSFSEDLTDEVAGWEED